VSIPNFEDRATALCAAIRAQFKDQPTGLIVVAVLATVINVADSMDQYPDASPDERAAWKVIRMLANNMVEAGGSSLEWLRIQ
jgi:hypothetical protein